MWLPTESSLRIMSLLVTPIALGALVMLIYVARRDRRFLEIFPLIFVQINMLFVWICTGAFFLYGNANQCRIYGSGRATVSVMLTDTINLVPLNVFMYSWRYLHSLEKDSQGNLRNFFRLFGRISLWAVPVTTDEVN